MRKLLFVVSVAVTASLQAASLPESMVFVGPTKYQTLVNRGLSENWRALPVGERTTKVGLALLGTPYKNYTLELDDRIEAPSVNMAAMDCWTFFEIALGTARALKTSENPTPQDLLRMIEIDRYRGGACTGVFTSRLHYLEQWLYDNQSRGLVTNVTPSLPGARKLKRELKQMSVVWYPKQAVACRPIAYSRDGAHRGPTLETRNLVRSQVEGACRRKISPQRRHRLHRVDLAARIHIACWTCLSGRKRSAPFHACFEKRGKGHYRFAPEQLPEPVSHKCRNHGRETQ